MALSGGHMEFGAVVSESEAGPSPTQGCLRRKGMCRNEVTVFSGIFKAVLYICPHTPTTL